jgi:hypothetical protein
LTELRFSRALYAGPSVEEAVKAFAGFAEFTLADEPAHWVVKVVAGAEPREQKVARELANHALGLTIRARGKP